MKELEHKEVFLRPTGNNVPRGKGCGDGCRFATITKVAKVNVHVKFTGWNYEEKFRMSDKNKRWLKSDFNSGWIVYESEDEYLADLRKEELCRKIADRFCYATTLQQFKLEQLEQVAEILGLSINAVSQGEEI